MGNKKPIKERQQIFHNDSKEDKALLKFQTQLTKKDRVILELMMLSPIPIVLAVLFTTHDFLITLVLFHIVLAACPPLFFKWKKFNINWKSLLKQGLGQTTRQIKHDLQFAGIPAVAIFSCYICFRFMFPDYHYDKLRLPAFSDALVAGLLVIDFVIINPVVEEFFWRFFCDLFTGQGHTLLHKLDVAAHYGLYHWFVVYFITQDAILSSVAFCVITTLGVIFTLIKQRVGLITVTLIHLGVDFAAGLALWDMHSKFVPLY